MPLSRAANKAEAAAADGALKRQSCVMETLCTRLCQRVRHLSHVTADWLERRMAAFLPHHFISRRLAILVPNLVIIRHIPCLFALLGHVC